MPTPDTNSSSTAREIQVLETELVMAKIKSLLLVPVALCFLLVLQVGARGLATKDYDAIIVNGTVTCSSNATADLKSVPVEVKINGELIGSNDTESTGEFTIHVQYHRPTSTQRRNAQEKEPVLCRLVNLQLVCSDNPADVVDAVPATLGDDPLPAVIGSNSVESNGDFTMNMHRLSAKEKRDALLDHIVVKVGPFENQDKVCPSGTLEVKEAYVKVWLGGRNGFAGVHIDGNGTRTHFQLRL